MENTKVKKIACLFFSRKQILATISIILFQIGLVSFAQSLVGAQRTSSSSEMSPCSDNSKVLWASSFQEQQWQNHWEIQKWGRWGEKNLKVFSGRQGQFSQFLRVSYPAKSASPSLTRKQQAPTGGSQFYARLGIPSTNKLCLSYFVRFPSNFDFRRGGKLPGLFGGKVNTGGNIPDGINGFSTRLMWRAKGIGEVYAYLPTSIKHGTSLGRGNWQFQPGVWHHIKQVVLVNDLPQKNGEIWVWVDNKLVLSHGGLQFRTTDTLKIEGILFSTFFGGQDASWATLHDTYVDFANFQVMKAL